MPRLGRRAGPVGIALTAWELWTRIPPQHRRRVLGQARKHGPKLVKQAMQARKAGKNRPPL
jgi:hypothetical protein